MKGQKILLIFFFLFGLAFASRTLDFHMYLRKPFFLRTTYELPKGADVIAVLDNGNKYLITAGGNLTLYDAISKKIYWTFGLKVSSPSLTIVKSFTYLGEAEYGGKEYIILAFFEGWYMDLSLVEACMEVVKIDYNGSQSTLEIIDFMDNLVRLYEPGIVWRVNNTHIAVTYIDTNNNLSIVEIIDLSGDRTLIKILGCYDFFAGNDVYIFMGCCDKYYIYNISSRSFLYRFRLSDIKGLAEYSMNDFHSYSVIVMKSSSHVYVYPGIEGPAIWEYQVIDPYRNISIHAKWNVKDFDNDGEDEIISFSPSHEVYLLNANLTNETKLPDSPHIIGDFDGNGYYDIISCVDYDNTEIWYLYLWYGDEWKKIQFIVVEFKYYSMSVLLVEDIDEDHAFEIILYDDDTATIYVVDSKLI